MHPIETIKKKCFATTQYVRTLMSTHFARNFRSPLPALNVPRWKESISTNIIYADTPGIDYEHTRSQLYCGTGSQVCDVYGMKTDK